MGETQMGRFKFSSWTLHMASIMIFSTLWGIAMREWTGTSRHTKRLVALTLLVLIASTVIIGYGNSLASTGTLMPGSSAWPRGPQTGACCSLFNPP
jgi:L-rhamnose-H+ transport protein